MAVTSGERVIEMSVVRLKQCYCTVAKTKINVWSPAPRTGRGESCARRLLQGDATVLNVNGKTKGMWRVVWSSNAVKRMTTVNDK